MGLEVANITCYMYYVILKIYENFWYKYLRIYGATFVSNLEDLVMSNEFAIVSTIGQ